MSSPTDRLWRALLTGDEYALDVALLDGASLEPVSEKTALACYQFDGSKPRGGIKQGKRPMTTPLLAAADMSTSSVVRKLLKAGANPNARGTQVLSALDFTPLLAATRRARPEVMKILLTAGATVDLSDNAGWTALHFVAFYGGLGDKDYEDANWDRLNDFAACGRLLLDAGASLLCRTQDGYTALHYAARCTNPIAVDALLHAGADPLADSAKGLPLDLARAQHLASPGTAKTDVIVMLMRAAAHARRRLAVTAFHAAAWGWEEG